MEDEKTIIGATENLISVGEDINRLAISIDQLKKSIETLDRESDNVQISILFGVLKTYGTSISLLQEKLQNMKDGK